MISAAQWLAVGAGSRLICHSGQGFFDSQMTRNHWLLAVEYNLLLARLH